MLTIKYSNLFKKDFKRIIKRGYNAKLLEEVVYFLANEKILPDKYRDHVLKSEYVNLHECHITSDWLLIYEINKKEIILTLTRTGTHSDLF